MSRRIQNGKNNPNFSHGLSHSPEYRVYHEAKYRCHNPKAKDFHNYGGRGIKFLYTSIEQFLTDVGKRPSAKHSLDRIKNNGHYKIGNCRWSLAPAQQTNKRPIRSIENFSDQEIRKEFYRRNL